MNESTFPFVIFTLVPHIRLPAILSSWFLHLILFLVSLPTRSSLPFLVQCSVRPGQYDGVFSCSNSEPTLLAVVCRKSQDKLKNVDLHAHLARKVKFEIRKAKLDYYKSKTLLYHMSNHRERYNHINNIIGNKET